LAALEAASLEGALKAFLLKLQEPGPDPIDLGQACSTLEPVVVVGWLQRWVYDMLQYKLAGAIRYFPNFAAGLQAAAGQTSALRLLELQRKLTQARALAQHPLNPRLYYESLFMDYRNALNRK
jgi:DNA polymerase-3 subunit delta'